MMQRQNKNYYLTNKTGRILFKTQRSFSMPSTKETKTSDELDAKNRSTRVSVSNENNVLLDPDVLTDFTTQTLCLTVLATLVKYSTDEKETRILYEYLAEASVVFPKVFPVINNLLDAKINSVLSSCHDQGILDSVQNIIQNMIANEDTYSQQQLHYLQSCGFGGLWRFAGPYTKCNRTAESAELFVNCLEAMVETCLPVEEYESTSNFSDPAKRSSGNILIYRDQMKPSTESTPNFSDPTKRYQSAANSYDQAKPSNESVPKICEPVRRPKENISKFSEQPKRSYESTPNVSDQVKFPKENTTNFDPGKRSNENTSKFSESAKRSNESTSHSCDSIRPSKGNSFNLPDSVKSLKENPPNGSDLTRSSRESSSHISDSNRLSRENTISSFETGKPPPKESIASLSDPTRSSKEGFVNLPDPVKHPIESSLDMCEQSKPSRDSTSDSSISSSLSGTKARNLSEESSSSSSFDRKE